MDQTDQNSQLISAKVLAKMLSLSARTVWRLRSAGKLPKPVCVGASIRWRLSDISLFLECDCDITKYHARKEQKTC
jgi:predicted DNA-binding transcriptional regulator AlpA